MKENVLMPQYIKKFRCITSECEDSCCTGWNIDIDKKTFAKYSNCKDKIFKQKFSEKVYINSEQCTSENYAKMKMDKRKNCPFLNEHMLCSIQEKFGEEYLSNTCGTYPRVIHIVNGVYEKSASMSCPEAARLALLNPSTMEFDEIEDKIINKENLIELNTKNNKKEFDFRNFFWDFRIFSIDVLQNRDYKLWERIVVLGLFYKKADELSMHGKNEEVLNLTILYKNVLAEGLLEEELKNIPEQWMLQIKILAKLLDLKTVMGIQNQRYFECFSDFLNGIQYSLETSIEDLNVNYREAYEKYYLPYMSQHEYILENYLVNYVFKNLFPFSGETTFFDNYTNMVIHYSMIKMLLIGMSAKYKEQFNVNHIVKLIQSFTKEVEHNLLYLGKINEMLKENRMNTMSYMAILIKN